MIPQQGKKKSANHIVRLEFCSEFSAGWKLRLVFYFFFFHFSPSFLLSQGFDGMIYFGDEAESSKPWINCLWNDTIVLILYFSHYKCSIIVTVFYKVRFLYMSYFPDCFARVVNIIGKCPPSISILQQFITIYVNFRILVLQFFCTFLPS